MDVWLPMLGDIDDEIGKAAVIQLCASGKGPPTIADIRETVLSLAEGDVVAPSPWEAWERALGGRSRTIIEKRALGLIGGEWEVRHGGNQGVTRSNFVKAYEDLLNNDRKRRLAIPSIKRLAESNRPPEVSPPTRRVEEESRKPATQKEVREIIEKLGNDNIKSVLADAGITDGVGDV